MKYCMHKTRQQQEYKQFVQMFICAYLTKGISYTHIIYYSSSSRGRVILILYFLFLIIILKNNKINITYYLLHYICLFVYNSTIQFYCFVKRAARQLSTLYAAILSWLIILSKSFHNAEYALLCKERLFPKKVFLFFFSTSTIITMTH